MSGVAARNSFLLEIPPDPEFLTTARLFTGAVVRQAGDENGIDDAKLAVTEAASLLMQVADDASSISLQADPASGGIRFTVSRRGTMPSLEADPELADTVVGLELVRAIFPSTALEAVDGTVTISFATN